MKLDTLIEKLQKINYEIVYQILNNEWNCIGLYVKYTYEYQDLGYENSTTNKYFKLTVSHHHLNN